MRVKERERESESESESESEQASGWFGGERGHAGEQDGAAVGAE